MSEFIESELEKIQGSYRGTDDCVIIHINKWEATLKALKLAEERLNSIKTKVIGEAAANNWPLGLAVTKNRGDIADLCDEGLAAFDTLGKE